MSRAQMLLKCQTSLQCQLEKVDLLKFSRDLLKYRVWSKDASDKFSTLDPDLDHLDADVKVRYLLQRVYEIVREDDNVYGKLVYVFRKHGVKVGALHEVMGRDIENVEESEADRGKVEEVELVEQDVSGFVEVLVSGSHLWDAIGIALNLPKHKRDNCGEGKENVNRLSNILTTWILGSYEGARPPTLTSLREALTSETVGLGRLAHKVMINREIIDPLPITKKPRYKLDIAYQSCDTKVAEDKSTLLEVQISNSRCESYQWSKDGQPLNDGTVYSGVNNKILYINKANQNMEGTYSCCVSRGCETECSDEMILSVIYPPEKQHLLEFYSLTEREVPQNSWPPVSNTTFINLVLIKQKQKPMSKCDYYTVRGDMDDILESKEEVIYEEVFTEYREGALVLVEGRPGSGKTTLVGKLTKDWATGKKVLQGAKMVFLVTLRLLNASGRDKTLLDLLQIFYGETISKSIEHDLQECRGKGACFILDGLDEYPLESKKILIIDQLLSTKAFPLSMVIVASRPVATQELKKYCKTRIEVCGFSKDQIYNYVKLYPFSECPVYMAYKMAKFLGKHPNVLHMCYLPVHAAIICFLFGELEGNIPHRETLIYEQFTIATLLKHKALKGEKLRLRSLEDLSGEDKTLFNSICKLALDMIVNSQQVISKSDAKISVLDSALELLTIEQTSKYYGSEDFYSFSHLTFQEFLAAYYIHEAQLEHKNLVYRMSKNVWKFYSGLSKSLENIKFLKLMFESSNFDFLFKVRCAYECQQVELCDYVVADGVVRVTRNITSTDLIALGYVISKSNKLVNSMKWKSDYSDCEGVKLFASMATHRKLQSITSLKIDWNTSEQFKGINCLLVHLPFLEKLEISGVHLDRYEIVYLTSEVKLRHLKVLKISLPLLPCSHPEKFIKLLAFNSKCMSQVLYSVHYNQNIDLVLWHKIIQCAFGSQIIQDRHKSWLHLLNLKNYNLSLHHERLSHCVEVVLINCCIGDEGAEILANSLNTSVLEKLDLDFNRISDAGIVVLAGCLSRCSVVREVSIQCNSIGDSGATALADAVCHCNSLRRLNLQGNSLGDEGAVAISKATKSLPSLDLYLHNVNITEEGIERVLEYGAKTRIRGMKFTSSWESVSETGIDTLKRALYSKNLPALRLSTSNIFVIEKLVTELDSVKNVSGIECKICISEDTVPTLCSIIDHLPGLHQIELSIDDSISSTSVQQLSNCLKTCESLHSLKIEYPSWYKSYSSVLYIASNCSKLKSFLLYFVIVDDDDDDDDNDNDDDDDDADDDDADDNDDWDDVSDVDDDDDADDDDADDDDDSDDVSLLFSNHESWLNLRTLKLFNCRINSDGAKVLSKMLIHCNKLRYLNLSLNGVGDSGALAIAEGLKGNTSLLTLNMGYNDITSEGMAGLCQVIKRNCLHCLDLTLNRVANSVPALVDVLCGDNLRALDLAKIGLGVDGIASLSVGLKKCTQLIKLNVSDNNIESRGVEYLAEGLQYCTKLQKLRLHGCNITSDGVTDLCSIMKSCKYLRRLDLDSNRLIGIDGAAMLVGGWQHKSVLELKISHCCDDPHDSALIKGEKCCSKCDRLLELYHKNDYIHIPDIPRCVVIS